MKEQIHIKCRRCNGNGHIALPIELLQVFNITSESRGVSAPVCSKKLDPQSRFHVTAFNNRLQDLMDAGLLRRERHGKTWMYFKIPVTPRKSNGESGKAGAK